MSTLETVAERVAADRALYAAAYAQGHADGLAEGLAQQAALPLPVARVLAERGVPPAEAAAFLAPKLRDLLPDPLTLRDMDVAAERLVDAALVGGSVSGGVASLRQTVAGPLSALRPYSAGVDGVFLCSSATPPGGGAHGMSGFNAAASVLDERG